MTPQQRHYSSRLGRQFRDGDELTRDEAAQVLSENSGRPIAPKYVYDLAHEGTLHPRYLSKRKLLYQYSEVKDYVVAAKQGRHQNPGMPSDLALRVRRHRAVHGQPPTDPAYMREWRRKNRPRKSQKKMESDYSFCLALESPPACPRAPAFRRTPTTYS